MRAASEKVQTTLRLPRSLFAQIEELLQSGVSRAAGFNEFAAAALRAYVRALRRKQIDAAFREMGADNSYQQEAEKLAEEFAESDWEALEASDGKARAGQ